MILVNEYYDQCSLLCQLVSVVALRYLFNLVHFPKVDYPGKMTQGKILSKEELSEQLDCLSEEQRARRKLQKTIHLTLSQ